LHRAVAAALLFLGVAMLLLSIVYFSMYAAKAQDKGVEDVEVGRADRQKSVLVMVGVGLGGVGMCVVGAVALWRATRQMRVLSLDA
jgi:hypothetical protein